MTWWGWVIVGWLAIDAAIVLNLWRIWGLPEPEKQAPLPPNVVILTPRKPYRKIRL